MVIQVTLRQLITMIEEGYLARAKIPCTHCNSTTPVDHEIRGHAETVANSILTSNLRKDDYKLQQS